MKFIAAAVIGSIVGAVAATAVLGLVSHADVLRGLLVWVQADTLGLVTLTPALLVMTQKHRAPIVWRESWTLGVLAAVAFTVFFVIHYPLLFIIAAALTLPTLRMGLPGAVAGFAIIAMFGTVAAFSNHGPIMLGAPADRIIGLQLFLAVSFY